MPLKERPRFENDFTPDELLEVVETAEADSKALAPDLLETLTVEIPKYERRLADLDECSLEAARIKNELDDMRLMKEELKQLLAS